MICKKINYFISFFIPILCLLILFPLFNLLPFGSNAFLYSDALGQYVPFLYKFKSLILNGGSLFYTFSSTLGSSTINLILYYLLDPFNIIIFFTNNITIALSIIVIIKIGISGVTMYILLNYIFKENTYIPKYIFSTCYALMGYSIMYFFHTMWLTNVILLPLVILGIYKFLFEKNIKYYTISLSLSIILNFYTGYMVFIFSILYFIYLILINKCYNKKIFFKFILLNVIVLGISAIVLIPVIFSLSSNGLSLNLSYFNNFFNINILELFNRFFISETEYVFGKYPNIYCGIICFILLIFYFINSKIEFREKCFSLLFITIFILSIILNPLNLIWHGLKEPVGFPFRFSFLFSFFIILLSVKSLDKLKYISFKPVIYSLLIIVPLLFFTKLFFTNVEIGFNKILIKNINIIYVAIYYIIFIIFILKEHRILKMLPTIIILELMTNIFISYYYMNFNIPIENTQEYKDIKKSVETVKEKDDNFYRMETTYNMNASYLFDYNSISDFTSTDSFKTRSFVQNVGIFSSLNVTTYSAGNTLFSSSLFGIKYIVDKNDKDILGFEKISDDTYINKNALPIAFISNNNLLNIKSEKNYDMNTFEFQNHIYKTLTGDTENIFTEYNDLEKEISYNLEHQKIINTNLEANINPLYMYIVGNNNYNIKIGTNNYNYLSKHPYILTINDQNTTTDLLIKKNDKKINFYGAIPIKINKIKCYVYSLDLEKIKKLNKVISEINRDTTIKYYNDSNIKIETKVINDKMILMTTIPYDEGWNIYIDGKKVKKEKILDNLIGVQLSKGKHQIEMRYFPKGLYYGMFVSTFFVLIFLLFNNKKLYYKSFD